MNAALESTPLCIADPATFWPWRRWPQFSQWQDPATTTVVAPLAGLADWGLGHALDLEETVLMHVLRAASLARPAHLSITVIPPLRFVLGPDPGCAFAVAVPLAHAMLAEVTASIAASGFKRVVFFNASPWNEELIAAAARDLRIGLGLQIFRISLSGLGLDLHPTRSSSRRTVQTLVTALHGREPEAFTETSPPSPRTWGDEGVRPLSGPHVPLAAALREGEATLGSSAHRLVSLLGEIAARAPLPHDGKIPAAVPT